MVVCKNCGKENQPQYKFCLYCGSDIHQTEGQTDGGPAPGAEAATKGVAEGDTADGIAPAAILEHVDRSPSGWLRGRLDLGDPNATPLPAPRPPSPYFTGEMKGQNPGTAPRRASLPLRSLVPMPAGRGEMVATMRPEGVPEATATERSGPVKAEPRNCPHCRALVPRGFQFCGQCGGRVEVSGAVVDGRRPVSGPVGRTLGRLLLIRPDGSEGGHHPLGEGVNIVGRGSGPLFDADSYLSPLHLQIEVLDSGMFLLRDAGSLNGVFMKLSEEEPINDGAVFRIGQELLRFDIIRPPRPLEDGTEIMGSPNPGYWGRIAIIIGKGQDGSCFPLFGDAVVLGRERGDILFSEDGYVSGTHVRISFRHGQVFLQDLASSNGTFLKVRGERTVRNGTYILMGQQLFRVVLA